MNSGRPITNPHTGSERDSNPGRLETSPTHKPIGHAASLKQSPTFLVPEKTNIVKKKLDEKNYVALTGLRSKCPLGKFKTKMTTHYVSAWFRRFYGKIGHC